MSPSAIVQSQSLSEEKLCCHICLFSHKIGLYLIVYLYFLLLQFTAQNDAYMSFRVCFVSKYFLSSSAIYVTASHKKKLHLIESIFFLFFFSGYTPSQMEKHDTTRILMRFKKWWPEWGFRSSLTESLFILCIIVRPTNGDRTATSHNSGERYLFDSQLLTWPNNPVYKQVYFKHAGGLEWPLISFMHILFFIQCVSFIGKTVNTFARLS